MKYIAIGVSDDRRHLPHRTNGNLRKFVSDPFEAGCTDEAFKKARMVGELHRGYGSPITELYIIPMPEEPISVPEPALAQEMTRRAIEQEVWGDRAA